jgi:18S rRNA (adenine1779-N6/adenine1780-N6)-dimethyltransferase
VNVRQVMSVSRKNFVSTPKVNSAVVSIQSHDHQIVVDFDEWDGLIKLCFTRLNRTLDTSFKKKKILKLLDDNRCAFFEAQEFQPPEIDIGIFIREVFDQIIIYENELELKFDRLIWILKIFFHYFDN